MDKTALSSIYAVLVPAIAAVVGAWHYTKFNRALKFLFYCVVLGVFSEIGNELLKKVMKINNTMLIGHVYFTLAFLFLGLHYMHLFKGYLHRWIFVVLIVCYELYYILNLLFVQPVNKFPAIPQAVSNMICFVWALVYFHKTMVEAKTPNHWKDPFIYTNLAILIYYSGSLFYSVLFNLILVKAIEITDYTIIYVQGINGVFYVLIAVGFWKTGKKVPGGQSR